MNKTTIKTILAIAFFMTALISNAQSFRLGLQASPQLNWLNTKNGTITNNRILPGIKYGLEVDLFLDDQPRYAFNTGLFVSNVQLDTHLKPIDYIRINKNEVTQISNLRSSFNYIEIPLNIKMRTDQFYRFIFTGQFGLAPSINVGTTGTLSSGQFSGADVASDFSFFNVALMMGAGAEYDLGKNTALRMGIQYSKGMVDVTRFGHLDDKTTLNTMQLIIGVLF